ncbi:MAG: hypothetical protein FNCTV4_gp1 [Sanya nephotettix cincticeps totivirus 1]|nr:MAG: hypothetical protein FNCTV4_gp1 [Sanya nephotettix cincticeps totivirus 1]
MSHLDQQPPQPLLPQGQQPADTPTMSALGGAGAQPPPPPPPVPAAVTMDSLSSLLGTPGSPPPSLWEGEGPRPGPLPPSGAVAQLALATPNPISPEAEMGAIDLSPGPSPDGSVEGEVTLHPVESTPQSPSHLPRPGSPLLAPPEGPAPSPEAPLLEPPPPHQPSDPLLARPLPNQPQPQPPPPVLSDPPRQAQAHEKLMHKLLPDGSESWLHRLGRMAEWIAPTVVAIGVGFVAPELAPLLPAITPEAEAALLESVEAVSAWSSLRSNIIDQTNQLPPETLHGALQHYKTMLEKPQLVRIPNAPLRLPSEAKELRRQEALSKAPKYLRAMQRRHPLTFSNQLIRERMFPLDSPHQLSHTRETKYGRSTKPTHVRPEVGLWAKIGDHSVHATDVTGQLLLDLEPSSPGLPNLCTLFGQALRDQDANFQVVAPAAVEVPGSGYQIGSPVSLSVSGGGIDVPDNMFGCVFPTHFGPIALGAPVVRHDLHVHGGPARELGRFTASAIGSFLAGGVPSERLVCSALQPNLQIANLVALRALPASILSGWEYFDNSYMYAKLWYYVLLNDLFAAVGGAPAAVPFPAAPVPTWIDLTNVALPPNSIPDAIERRDIIFIEGKDILMTATDLQIVHWLVLPGMRYDGPEGGPTPHAVYVEWSSIPVTILARRAAPQPPAAAVITSTALISFINRIATKRAEWSSALKGMYLAFDLLGVRLAHFDDEWWPIRSNMSSHNPWVPAARDYNVLLRELLIFPDDKMELRNEVSAFTTLLPINRVRVVALYTAMISTTATTLLYDLNITANMLLQHATGAAATSPAFSQIMAEALNQFDQSTSPVEAFFMSQCRRAFPEWIGVHVCMNLYPEDTWAGDFGNNAGAAVVYQLFEPNITPAFYDPLVLVEWLRVLPFEWGFCGVKPTLNLKSELRLLGPAAQHGWFAVRGSSHYAERASGDFPMKVVAYGAQVINALAQHFRLDAQHIPVVSRQAADWVPEVGDGKNNIIWGPPALVPGPDQIFVPGVHSFRPCSFMTYNYATGEVWAPALIGDALGPGEINRLQVWVGQSAEQAGIFLPKVGVTTMPLKLPAQLNLMRIGGLRSRSKADAPDAVPAQEHAPGDGAVAGDGGARTAAGNPN